MQKNEQFELKIIDMSDEGAGIGKDPETGFTWFVKDAVIGDRIIAAATKIKKNYGFARLAKLLEPSPDRVSPRCPEARRCGGCQIQQLSYAAQLSFKTEKVRNDLLRIGGLDIEMEPIIGMADPWRYRNKAVYPVGADRDGRPIAGFYAGRTHSIISCEDCHLGDADNAAILRLILSFMEEKHIPAYDEVSHRGTVRHVLIRKGWHTKELMICLIINAEQLKEAAELAGRLQAAFPKLRSFSLNINKEKTNVILGSRVVPVYGPAYIEEEIGEILPAARAPRSSESDWFVSTGCRPVRFRISPLSFFQVNSRQMERLYGTALEFAGLTGAETVWDLYCGVGTISLFLARHCKKVYGVEMIPAAIENARENAALNDITNAEFFVGKAEEVLPAWHREQKESASAREAIDVIVVDPPRKGCDPRCLETMVQIAPRRIVYVSCDPATLARDLRYLTGNGYHLDRARPCDMFPHTVHIETVVLMSRV